MHIKVSEQCQLVSPPALLQLGIQSDTWLEVDAEQEGVTALGYPKQPGQNAG